MNTNVGILSALKAIAAILASTGFITGCAPMISGAMNVSVTNEIVITKTAKYFGVTHKEVTVTAMEKGPLSTSYQTIVSDKFYNCILQYGDVSCKQPGS